MRRPPRSTLDRSSAASDVYKSQVQASSAEIFGRSEVEPQDESTPLRPVSPYGVAKASAHQLAQVYRERGLGAVSYTHLRAHETVLDLVCRLLLENKHNKKKKKTQ